MTRKLTLFLVCAFQIALILFVAAWPARAGVATMRYETSSQFEFSFYRLETDLFSKKKLHKKVWTMGADLRG